MKQYTTPEQTAKLIELGFAEPKGYFCKVVRGETPLQDRFTFDCNYSIGELIGMLPKELECASLQLYHAGLWSVSYPLLKDKYYVASFELCDALCEMICYLKEEGVI